MATIQSLQRQTRFLILNSEQYAQLNWGTCKYKFEGCLRDGKTPNTECIRSKILPYCFPCFEAYVRQLTAPYLPKCKGDCTFILDRRIEGEHSLSCYDKDSSDTDDEPTDWLDSVYDEEKPYKSELMNDESHSNTTDEPIVEPTNEVNQVYSCFKSSYPDTLPRTAQIDQRNNLSTAKTAQQCCTMTPFSEPNREPVQFGSVRTTASMAILSLQFSRAHNK
uniref:CxC5 domain-containing protein n=1 Tax=Panagrellus redivivus TaxID=6233 RepID=A0A7E4W8W2_PANRE